MTKSLRDEIEEAAKLYSDEEIDPTEAEKVFRNGATAFAIRALEMAVAIIDSYDAGDYTNWNELIMDDVRKLADELRGDGK